MNEIIQAMIKRHIIRKFQATAVLEENIAAELYAASGMERQATAIVAVTERALRDRLAEMKRAIGGWAEIFCRREDITAEDALAVAVKRAGFTVEGND